MTKRRPDHVLIIGAGVVGLSTGFRLLQRGCAVTIMERNAPGSGASNAAAGMLAPTAEVRFEEEHLLQISQESLALYPDFVAELQEQSGVDVDYRTQGTLVLGLDRDDTATLAHLLNHQHTLGLDATMLSGEEARAMEPAISVNIHSAVHCPTDHQVDPRKLVCALTQAFLNQGGTLHTHTKVTSLETTHDRVVGVRILEESKLIHADAVCVAMGAWSRRLEGIPKKERPVVRPVRGQMLSLELPTPQFCTHVLRAPDAYLVPKSDGRMIVGATMEEMGFDDRLTAGGIFEILRGAWETMPGIYDMPILEQWVGFRPMTLKNEPILERHERLHNLWYATGHGRNGILLTPWTAKTMSDLILR